MKRRNTAIPTVLSFIVVLILILLVSTFINYRQQRAPVPSGTATPSLMPSETPEEIPSGTPDTNEGPNEGPAQSPVIRTDYEAFKPNEAGEIPVIMFHRFVEKYEPDTDKFFATTFTEFETLLQTLYDQGFRLISMRDFIDCNISVPAGTMPMVFTFDDGSAGQFSLIEENGSLKVNSKSAAGIMIAFHEKHPDFGLKGIFYVNMDTGVNTFLGEGTLRERFEYLESLGFELGNHTYGHVDYNDINNAGEIQESIGKNQAEVGKILSGIRFYSLALPYGSRPKDESLRGYLQNGTYEGINYHHETIMAVGAAPTQPSISKIYNSQYVPRIRGQGKEPVDADLTWWLPKMTKERMFVSDGDPKTIVVPADKQGNVDEGKLGDKKLISY